MSELAEHYLEEAGRRLRTAERAFREGAYAYTVRQSQECVELSLKAALRLVMVEYPKKHDVGGVLERESNRFPSWFRDMLPEMAKASSSLAEKRSLAVYGDEVAGRGPESLFNEEDGRRALKSAETVYRMCRKLLEEWRQ